MSPQTATIVVDQDAVPLLQAIQSKAHTQGTTLGSLLRPLVENGNNTAVVEKPFHETSTPEEWSKNSNNKISSGAETPLANTNGLPSSS